MMNGLSDMCLSRGQELYESESRNNCRDNCANREGNAQGACSETINWRAV